MNLMMMTIKLGSLQTMISKHQKNAARKDILNIRKKHKWSRDYLSSADERIGAGQYATGEFEKSMKNWVS